MPFDWLPFNVEEGINSLDDHHPVKLHYLGQQSGSSEPFQYGSMVDDSETKAFFDWYNKLDNSLSAGTKDYLVQNWFNNRSSELSFQRELQANSTQYQRLVADLQKAGLNPMLAISGLSSAGSASSSPGSVSGGHFTQRKTNNATNTTNAMKAVLGILASVAAALIFTA